MNKKAYWPFASLFFCAALYLIWPLAHTIALRKLLLLVSAVIGVVLWIRSDDRYAILKSPWLILLALLLAWVLFHAAFISQNGTEAWRELLGQWIPAFFAVLAGIGLALASRSFDPTVFRIYLLAVLAAQPVLFLLVSVYKSIQIGHLATEFYIGMLGTDLKTSLTFSSDMLAALACAKILESYKAGTHSIKNYVWLIPIVLAMYVAIFSASLNSILLISACTFLMIVLLGYKLRNRVLLTSIAVLALLISIYVVSFMPSAETGWKRMISNSKIAVNIDTYKNWTNFRKLGLPENEMGEQLPESFYLRVAYARAGLRAVLEHPWGYGVTRHAFERLVQQKYPDVSIANAHNGYLNLSSAVGIPGLLLFSLVLVAIFRQLKNSSSELAHPAAWMIGIYVIHWALDALERDHFFESYLFVIALLLTLSFNQADQKTGA
jgi:O-Antigen ligase